jgi:pyruvate,water dikinase
VGGTVTLDTFAVRKSDLAVTSRSIAGKERMTVPVPGGTREVNVPRFLRLEACLAEEQLIEIARLALSLETTMGYPVDIECAYAGGELYLLQCRPIITLG